MRNFLNAPISGVAEFIALSVPACVFLQLPSAISQRRLMRAEMAIEYARNRTARASPRLFNADLCLIGLLVFGRSWFGRGRIS